MAVVTPELLKEFLEFSNAKIAEDYKQNYPLLTPRVLVAQPGVKYIRIVAKESPDHETGSAWCFIGKANGAIYKSDSWKSPAKHSRGNLSDPDFSWGKGLNVYGGTYLR